MIPETKFGAVLADPNWAYDNWTDAKNGAAASAYACSPTEEIAKVPVAQFAAKNCILYLWATLPKLPDAMAVGAAWGFGYVTAVPWFKTVPSTQELAVGVGFWTQGNAELLTIWRRGKPKRKKTAPHVVGYLYGEERVFYAPRKRHSEKPLLVYDWIEQSVDGPYCELYGRRTTPCSVCQAKLGLAGLGCAGCDGTGFTARPGWSVYGHDTGCHLNESGVGAL